LSADSLCRSLFLYTYPGHGLSEPVAQFRITATEQGEGAVSGEASELDAADPAVPQ